MVDRKLAAQKAEYEGIMQLREQNLREEMERETIRLRHDLEDNLADAANGAMRAREVAVVVLCCSRCASNPYLHAQTSKLLTPDNISPLTHEPT